jgi:hypothetical protein
MLSASRGFVFDYGYSSRKYVRAQVVLRAPLPASRFARHRDIAMM